MFFKKVLLFISLLISFSLFSNTASLQKTISFSTKRNIIYMPYMMSSQPDPLNIRWSGDWAAVNHAYKVFIDFNSDREIIPSVAKSWKNSLDGKTWTFEIDQDLYWSNGKKISIEEIHASLNISLKGTSHTKLKDHIKEISISKNGTIKFFLNRPIPSLLISLSYIDWAIIPKSSVIKSDNNFHLKKLNPCSGSFCIPQSKNNYSVKTLNLTKNPFVKNSINIDQLSLQYFQNCDELIKNHDKIISFRSYNDELDQTCIKNLKEKGFEISIGQPTWVHKVDFLKLGLKEINLNSRKLLLSSIYKKLKKDYSNIGTMLATGLRPSNIFGSLTESEYDDLIKSFKIKNTADIKQLSIVTMEKWAQWKSFKWLVNHLSSLKIKLNVHTLEKSEFFKSIKDGSLDNKYHLIYIPKGVGDHDPDGTWRLSLKYNYKLFPNPERLDLAYFEVNSEKRELLYKNIVRELISNVFTIPLVMQSDYTGLYKDYKYGKPPAFRTGISLNDIYNK